MDFLKYVFALLVLLTLFSCSSSSTGQRYNRAYEEKEKEENSPRFSSENDEKTFRAEFDEEPVEDHPVDVEKFVAKNESISEPRVSLSDKEKIMMEIVKYLNTPYQYGGNNKSGIDCSAFTQNVFSNSLNYYLPRTASEQFSSGENVNNKNLLKFGDLVFFDTTKESFPGHVGIYLGEDLFAHASFSKGVTVSSLKSSYFQTRYVGARREVEINKINQ